MTLDQVRRLASLSRLTLSASEEQRLIGEFSSILEYFGVVDRVGDATTPEKSSGANVVRPDEIAPSDPEGVLKCVPRRRGRLVRAPRVF
jgi:aspartyl/glutamyl-tRNA(Asn/Gln) amidotransferase C subunit